MRAVISGSAVARPSEGQRRRINLVTNLYGWCGKIISVVYVKIIGDPIITGIYTGPGSTGTIGAAYYIPPNFKTGATDILLNKVDVRQGRFVSQCVVGKRRGEDHFGRIIAPIPIAVSHRRIADGYCHLQGAPFDHPFCACVLGIMVKEIIPFVVAVNRRDRCRILTITLVGIMGCRVAFVSAYINVVVGVRQNRLGKDGFFRAVVNKSQGACPIEIKLLFPYAQVSGQMSDSVIGRSTSQTAAGDRINRLRIDKIRQITGRRSFCFIGLIVAA